MAPGYGEGFKETGFLSVNAFDQFLYFKHLILIPQMGFIKGNNKWE